MNNKINYEAKLQEISQLTADTEKNLTRSRQNWTAFLTTASRLYKYPYDEQLMIYAQRPEATACAEFNIWNNTMNRYIRRGSKGIALLNNDGDNPEIRYVFDVSDTGTRENSRSVNQWLLTDENEQAVMTALSEKYGVDSNRSISVQLESIAAQLVDEFWNNHKRTIIGIVDDSFLEEYDEDNIGMAFRNAGVVSTTYALLSRCGLEPDGYFEHEDFLSVFDFNTPGTVAVLGSAVSECAEDVLRQIEITIKTFEKERSKDYGRNHLQTQRGLSHSEPQIEGQREETSRQVRKDEKSIPEGTQPDTVESPHFVGETVRPPSRSGRIGNKPHGAASVTVDEAVRSDGGTERERPDEVGTVDEQHSSDSRGNSAERADIQLKFEAQEGDQLSLFPSEAEQIQIIENNTESILPSVFSFANKLSQDVIDEALRLGSNDEESRIKICAHFMKGNSLEENAVFLAEHYKTNGAGFYVNGRKYAMWYSIGGIQIADGETANKPYATTVTWEQVAERIKELLVEGKYMPQWEIDRAENFEARDVAARLLYMTADISEDSKSLNLLPTVSAIRDLRKGYPEETQVLFEYLNNPQKLKTIVDEMESFMIAYDFKPSILRFNFYKPQELLNRLKDMQNERLIFSTDRSYEPEHKRFISQDEIDNILSYRNTSEYRLKVYSYFITHPDPEERMKFLRKSHGEYSGSHSGNDNLTYTSKGIKFTHGDISNPYAEVQLPWKKATKRIAELIKADRYLSARDKENMPHYERHLLATNIHSFFFGVNENTPFPRTDDDISNYWGNVKIIQKQLTDPIRVKEIYNDMMLPVWNETKPDDRYYRYRKKGIEDMTAYIEGRYSVYGKDAPLEPLPQIEKNAPSNSSYFDEVVDIIADNPDAVVLFQVGDFFEMYGEDADIAVEQLGLIAATRYIPEMGTVPMCGIPSHILEQNVEKLREHFNVIVSGITNGERNQYRLPSYDEDYKEETLNRAKELINDFCEKEYGKGADFSDLQNVEVAYSTLTDAEIPVQVCVNLVDFRIDRYIDNNHYDSRTYDSLEALIDDELYGLNFDDLVHISDEALESQIHTKTDAEIDNFDDVDPAAIRENLAEHGIVNGEVVDPEALKNAPFIQQVINDVTTTFTTPAGQSYSIGDEIVTLWDNDEPSAVFQIEDVTEDYIYYTFPDLPEQDAVEMSREQFEKYLDSGNFTVRDSYTVIDEPEHTVTPSERFEIHEISVPYEGDKFAVYDNEINDFYIADDNLTHWFDTEEEALADLEDIKNRVASERAVSIEHNEELPIGRIEFLHTDGTVRESKEYTSEYLLKNDIKEENYFGVPMQVVLYSNADGKVIPHDYISALDPPLQGFSIIDNPHTVTKQNSISFSIGFSEHPVFYDKQLNDRFTDLSFALGNRLLGVLDEKQHRERNEKEIGWYHKTDFKIEAVIDGEDFSYSGRFDIGDGEGDLIAHIRNNLEYIISPDSYMVAEWKKEGEEYCNQQIAEHRRGIDILLPFLEKHSELTNDDEKKFAEIMATEADWWTRREEPVEEVAEFTEIPEETVVRENFHITDEHLGEGGAKAKFRMNMDAINLLKELEFDGRNATPEEQEVLSRYVGWGGLPEAFDETKESWTDEYKELIVTLSPEEYEAARGTVLNSHYTSPAVIKAMYDALANMGFTKGNILEPSMGIGNFFGMLPDEMKDSRLYGVELDSLTGRIAKQLYPKADITIGGFETTDRKDFYDVAIGNVPFGQYKVDDRAFNKLGFNIHNYFFAKALDQVRPGGVVAFVTTRHTMDSKNPNVRRYLAERADLLGAIRLPNNTFKANAGTEVVSDIIFLQKRESPIAVEPDWVGLGTNEQGYAINRYFLDNSEMVIGRETEKSTAHGMDYTVEPYEDLPLSRHLAYAVQNIGGTYTEAQITDLGEDIEIAESLPADPNVKNYSFTVVDNEVYYRENSVMTRPITNATALERIKGMVGLRNCVNELIELQMNERTTDNEIKEKQAELNSLYDAFSKKYGLINDRANRLAFENDSSYYLLCSLEVLDDDKKLKRKADMFTKRTIRHRKPVDRVDTASEALAVSIGERACVDLAFMANLLGGADKIPQIVEDLRGVIFKEPSTGSFDFEQGGENWARGWQTADEYLSGNVRKKLRQAQRYAKSNPEFQINVEALEKVQPKDLDASEIEIRIGTTWVDKEVFQQFMYETFETPQNLQRNLKVLFSPVTAEWRVEGKTYISRNDVAAHTKYGTNRESAYYIFEDTLNLRDTRIFDTVYEDGKEKRVLNVKETTLAAQKQQLIKDAFKAWVFKDPERRQALVRKYNEEMNCIRPREYDGSHITFSGMNPAIELREHQKNAIAHVLYGGNTLLAHEVGAGKTFEMVASAMELKRLGLCSKSMIVVPNHLTGQWASEFLTLYPSANILVTTKKDFQPANRKKFCARIATGDYDAVIIGHSQFEKIPVSFERQKKLIAEEINEITNGISELKENNGEHFTIKQLEITKRNLENRLKKLQANHKKDSVVTFEQLGVDRLFVDESDNYKNLFIYTKMRNVAGLSTTDAQKSSDMFMKCRYLDEITENRGVVFATGTPISNSMTEMFSIQRYLQYDLLQEMGMGHFDCWASRFGETTTALELAPEGTGYRARTRFAKFFNLPELMNMFKEVADIKTADQLNLPTPEVEYVNCVSKPTETQKAMVKTLSERATRVHQKMVEPTEDNMLKITSDGRKLGLDQRIINSMLPDEETTKVNQCVNNIIKEWREGEKDKLTQLVFCDLSTPKKAPVKPKSTIEAVVDENTVTPDDVEESVRPFTIYEDIRYKLTEKGMPPEQIAFIHEADTEAKKQDLFAKVRSGQVRVLIGSTQKMGAGTNVQDRLIASHDLDCPWRPRDLIQRKGRIERQGNMNPKVRVYRYVTEGTFDAYLWQTIENKQRFISQIMTSKTPVRSCEDIDEAALSYAEIKALCAGDPRIKERMDLDVEVSKLKMMRAEHQSNQFRLEDNLIKYFPETIKLFKGYIKGFEADKVTLAKHPLPAEGFVGMEIRGDKLIDKENAGAALLDALKDVKTQEPVSIGSYRGFEMLASYSSFRQEYEITLKGEMSYTTTLGNDTRGNIVRIDNALSNLDNRLNNTKEQLKVIYQQQESAKAEVGKPFPQEQELEEKIARLTELDVIFNLSGRNQPQSEQIVAKSSRPSVLDQLKDAQAQSEKLYGKPKSKTTKREEVL